MTTEKSACRPCPNFAAKHTTASSRWWADGLNRPSALPLIAAGSAEEKFLIQAGWAGLAPTQAIISRLLMRS
jgi:hypothetical protein